MSTGRRACYKKSLNAFSSLGEPLLGVVFHFLGGFIGSGLENQGITGLKTNGYLPGNMAAKILSEKCMWSAEASMGTDVSDKLMTAAYQLIS